MNTILKKAASSILLVLLFFSSMKAQQATLHGYIKDKTNGETLIGASVTVKGTTTGAITNMYGFYSLTLPAGTYNLVISYLGYNTMEFNINLDADNTLNCELLPSTEAIDEVVVTAEGKNENVTSTRMGVDKLEAKTIERIPVLMGETDVIKSLQLLPGVVATGETSSNLSIRGGGRDQNLILLDEATVYNASHLLGLFSVFNTDAIKNVELYKGIIPAQYGGRVASLIDIRMKEGNTKQFSGAGSIGLLTSKLTLEVPVVKNKGAILLSGRRTYLDLLSKMVKKAAPDKVESELPIFFYDFNAKANFEINENNRIYLSGYFGRDVASLAFGEEDIKDRNAWGNYTATLRWNHILNSKLFSNYTLIASNYNYQIENEVTYEERGEKKKSGFTWDSELKDYGLKADFGYFLNPNNMVRFGAQMLYHDFNIGKIESRLDTLRFNYSLPKSYSSELAAYLCNQQKIGRMNLEYGLRVSAILNVGSSDVYSLQDYKVVDTTHYKQNEIFNHYVGLEPRFSASYTLDSRQSIKLGYGRTRQYLHVASNSQSGTPLDVWMPVGKNIKPQIVDQVSLGYFRNFANNTWQTSVETYYKYMQNQVEFREFSQPYFNPLIDEEFRFGKGKAYGLELQIEKKNGRLTGWTSYTLSRSILKIKDIQEKDWFLSPYDVTHNVSCVASYELTPRLAVSANWTYSSGKPFSAPVARWYYGENMFPYFGGKNESRFPDYHRMDLGIEWKNRKRKHFESSWTFSIYNVYNRKNANTVYFTTESTDDGMRAKANQVSILPRLISVSYNFKF